MESQEQIPDQENKKDEKQEENKVEDTKAQKKIAIIVDANALIKQTPLR